MKKILSFFDWYYNVSVNLRKILMVVIFLPLYLTLMFGSLLFAKHITNDFSTDTPLIMGAFLMGLFGNFMLFIYPIYRFQKTYLVPPATLTLSKFLNTAGFPKYEVLPKGHFLTWFWLFIESILSWFLLEQVQADPTTRLLQLGLIAYALVCILNFISSFYQMKQTK